LARPCSAGSPDLPAAAGAQDFILDEARLIEPRDQRQIRAICERLLSERQVPIVVVTISSLVNYDASEIEPLRVLRCAWSSGFSLHTKQSGSRAA
jgi:hypothetical protein